MEAKKSKKAAIENQRGSWLLMGLVVALAFMFVSFESGCMSAGANQKRCT